jgi:hypothetical protein
VPGPDASSVFTELVAPPSFSFDGWSLVGVNGANGDLYRIIDLTGAVVPADGIFVVATASAMIELARVRDFIANVDWQNGPDAIQLRNALDEIVDALQYGDAGERNAGEGVPASRVAPGQSLSRNEASLDTNDNAADFRESAPSAGWVREEAVPVPEPSTLALVLVGAAGLVSRRRMRVGRALNRQDQTSWPPAPFRNSETSTPCTVTPLESRTSMT